LGSGPRAVTEAARAEHFRKAGVRVGLDPSPRMCPFMDEPRSARWRLRQPVSGFGALAYGCDKPGDESKSEPRRGHARARRS
jgi:hypothetical protein